MRHKIMRSSPMLFVLGLVLFAALVSRSGINLLDLPAIGGGVSGKTYTLNLEFDNALNLPERAFVKLNGVDVGYVTRIETEDYKAHVRIGVRDSVELPRGTTAQLRQATPLGDVFVSLTLPRHKAALLRDGDTISDSATSAAPQIEDMLAAASLLINGGSIADLGTITTEMNAFLGGNEQHVGSVIRQLGGTVAVLNERSKDIDAALAQLDDVARLFHGRRATLKAALTDFTPAISLVADERRDIVALLTKLTAMGSDVVEIVQKGGTDLVASVRSISEVLRGFGDIGTSLGPTLRDMIQLGNYAELASRGENLAGTAHFGLSKAQLDAILELLTPPGSPIGAGGR